ncbi:MAG TPA: hypothetical protein DCE14_05770 [Kosmotogaceae bacterium]|nr:hypothetical protein [Kosmotogaceae bacterium]
MQKGFRKSNVGVFAQRHFRVLKTGTDYAFLGLTPLERKATLSLWSNLFHVMILDVRAPTALVGTGTGVSLYGHRGAILCTERSSVLAHEVELAAVVFGDLAAHFLGAWHGFVSVHMNQLNE